MPVGWRPNRGAYSSFGSSKMCYLSCALICMPVHLRHTCQSALILTQRTEGCVTRTLPLLVSCELTRSLTSQDHNLFSVIHSGLCRCRQLSAFKYPSLSVNLIVQAGPSLLHLMRNHQADSRLIQLPRWITFVYLDGSCSVFLAINAEKSIHRSPLLAMFTSVLFVWFGR